MCGLYSSAPKDPLDTLNGFAQRDLVGRMLRKEPSRVLPRQFGKACVLEFPRAVWETSLGGNLLRIESRIALGCKLVNIRRERRSR